MFHHELGPFKFDKDVQYFSYLWQKKCILFSIMQMKMAPQKYFYHCTHEQSLFVYLGSNHDYCLFGFFFQDQHSVAIASNDYPGIDKTMLVERIVKLQRAQQRKNEKIEFMQEHVNSLVDEIKKKSK